MQTNKREKKSARIETIQLCIDGLGIQFQFVDGIIMMK